jgi:hypothetical protein
MSEEPGTEAAKPVRTLLTIRPPRLFSVNGIGLRLHGRRARDPETGSYVRTRSLTFVFVPLLALDAWRVLDAEDGWYCLAKERLTGFDRKLNASVLTGVLALIAFGAWQQHFGSERYLSAQKLAQADEQRSAGRIGAAARLYAELVESDSSQRREAEARFAGLADELATATLAEITAVAAAAGAERQLATEALLAAGFAAAETHAPDDPGATFLLLEALVPALAPAAPVERPAAVLTTLAAALPADPRPASLLAELWERAGDSARCETLLEPHAARLGTLEGARILGQLRLGQDRLEESQRLLEPYVGEKLPRLHAAAEECERLYQRSQEEALEQLNRDSSFRRTWEAASEDRRETLVEGRITAHLRDDRALARAQAEFERASAIVPVALSLGVVQLRRAQAASGPERTRGLEAAEQTFLALRGNAGEEAEFQFLLGQVYYWLGKETEGRALLEQFLASEERSSPALATVAGVLREVGRSAEARTLAEEAYESARDDGERDAAASLRYVLGIDQADRMAWLERCTSDDPFTRANRAFELGLHALNSGDRAEARSKLGEAVDGFCALTGSSAAFNNAATAQRNLSVLLGTSESLEKSLELFERALALEPANSIGLWNTAEAYASKCAFDLVAGEIDLARLGLQPGLGQLEFLYDDEAGHEQHRARLASDASLQRAAGCMARYATLAPQDLNACAWRLEHLERSRDLDALARFEQECNALDIERADGNEQLRGYYAGEEWALVERRTAVARLEARLAELEPAQGTTYAVAAVQLAGALQGLAPALPPAETDVNRLVALAESAFAAAPARATRQALIAALAQRAVATLAARFPDLAELAARTRRSTSHHSMLVFALNAAGPPRAELALDEDVVRLLELERDALRRLPSRARPSQWALFRTLDPELASTLAKSILNDEAARLARRIDTRIHPMHTGPALERCWELVLAGEDAAARELLAEFERRGVPMPRLP